MSIDSVSGWGVFEPSQGPLLLDFLFAPAQQAWWKWTPAAGWLAASKLHKDLGPAHPVSLRAARASSLPAKAPYLKLK